MTNNGLPSFDLDQLQFDVDPSELTGSFNFQQLRRWPAPEAENLQAFDATDALLLDVVANLARLHLSGSYDPSGKIKIAVLNEQFGAISLALQTFAINNGKNWDVTSWSDSIVNERAIHNNAAILELPSPVAPTDSLESMLSGAVVILIQAPRSHSELRQMIEATNRAADKNALVLVGGRIKYLTNAINNILGEYFVDVRASRARSKSRVIVAHHQREQKGDPEPVFPLLGTQAVAGRSLHLAAFGATFGGTKVDPGTRFLLENFPSLMGPKNTLPREIVDLGCGNGTISVFTACHLPEFEGTVIATDASRDAVRAARETARLNQVNDRVKTIRDDAMSAFQDESHQLILLNPPFHVGNTVDPNIALKLFKESARVLKPRGELWCVWNSPLQYKRVLNSFIGETTEIAKNRKFTVTRSVKRH